jgi:hypothetical protein
MALANQPARLALGYLLACIALGFAGSACVAKPAFHCQSDDACVATDGSHGTCEVSGECTFQSALANQAGTGGASGTSGAGGTSGASGASASIAGTASAEGGASSSAGGHGGSAGEAPTAGAAGASCTDAADNCYACTPQTSTQFLNACTSSACVPFDDHARLTKLTAGGTLPPLPPASGQ